MQAKLCVEGLELVYAYCDENQLPYKRCGKLIVAVEQDEEARIDTLLANGIENGVKGLEIFDAQQIRAVEPHCVGRRAIWSPNTGIIDFALMTRSLAENVRQRPQCDVKVGFEAQRFVRVAGESDYPLAIYARDGRVMRCRAAIVCAGLQADRVAGSTGGNVEPVIVPFRGDYLELKEEKRSLVHTNIYPVPDPRFPFLGVHFTPR